MKERTINGKPIREIWAELQEAFPPECIKIHPVTKRDYVPVEKIEERLNRVVGIENWDFLLLSPPQIYQLGPSMFESCVTSGQLIIYDDDRVPIIRSSGGAADVIYPTDSDRPTSVANAVASAGQDVFKRCAKRFGVARFEKDAENNSTNGGMKKEKGKLMKVLVLEPFKALPKGGAKVKVSFEDGTVELIIWKENWNNLQQNYAKTFQIGSKINEMTFYGVEGEFKGKKQLQFLSLPAKRDVA